VIESFLSRRDKLNLSSYSYLKPVSRSGGSCLPQRRSPRWQYRAKDWTVDLRLPGLSVDPGEQQRQERAFDEVIDMARQESASSFLKCFKAGPDDLEKPDLNPPR